MHNEIGSTDYGVLWMVVTTLERMCLISSHEACKWRNRIYQDGGLGYRFGKFDK